jgi:hypothetical protein
MTEDTTLSTLPAEAASEPDLPALLAELQQIDTNKEEIVARRRTAYDVRYCRWEGQSEDLRKHAEDLGEAAFPYEGAADTRIHLADELIRDRVALFLQSLFRAEVQAVAVESGDLAQASRVTTLLRWLRDTRLARELRHEAELAAQWMEGDDPGVAIVGVYWKQESALQRTEVDQPALLKQMYPEEVLANPQTAAAAQMQFQDILFNPAREEEALTLLGQAFPTVKAALVRRALKELRETGRTVLPTPYVRENRPQVVAHRLMDDLFVPLDTDDIQRARVIFRREWVSKVELRERVVSAGYDADWVEAVLERGAGAANRLINDTEPKPTRSDARGDEHENDFEIWLAVARQVDDMGIPGIYMTVFSGAVRDMYAVHKLLGYAHGEYPFIALRREVPARGLTESRGATVVAATHQYEIKVQRDARTNHTQLATNPPLLNRVRAGAMELAVRPGSTVPVRDASDVQWMQPPPGQVASLEIESATRGDCDRYFGRAAKDLDPTRVALLTQSDADRWLAGWQLIFAQVLALCQQYMDPAEIARVTGERNPAPVAREEIRGRFDATLKIDVRDLNLEFLKMKMELVGSVLTMDTFGTVNRAKLVRAAFRGIDPQIADEVVENEEAVSMREVEEEQSAVAKMALGIEVPPRESGQNFQLRSKVLEDTIGKSPDLQAKLAQGGLFTQLVEARRKHFQQMLQQQQNAQIGRTGYVPVLGG